MRRKRMKSGMRRKKRKRKKRRRRKTRKWRGNIKYLNRVCICHFEYKVFNIRSISMHGRSTTISSFKAGSKHNYGRSTSWTTAPLQFNDRSTTDTRQNHDRSITYSRQIHDRSTSDPKQFNDLFTTDQQQIHDRSTTDPRQLYNSSMTDPRQIHDMSANFKVARQNEAPGVDLIFWSNLVETDRQYVHSRWPKLTTADHGGLSGNTMVG